MADAHSTEVTWLPVEDWPGYEVSSNGDLRRADGSMVRHREDHGYRVVYLMRRCYVHRLVAEAFCPNPDAKPHVNHINNDGEDNRVVNLEWCTQSENIRHAIRIGAIPPSHRRGVRSINASLTDEQVRQIRWRYAKGGYTYKRLAAEHNVKVPVIKNVIQRRSYRDVE